MIPTKGEGTAHQLPMSPNSSQEEATKRRLYSYAIVLSYDIIEARIEIEADKIVKLFQNGHITEALAIMESPNWKG